MNRVPRPVVLLGLTSLFTDAATEMAYPLLPIFLSRVLGASAISLGIIEGVAEAANSLLKVGAGWWSDRRRTRRPIVIGGYALSSIVRPLIALATAWWHVLVVRALDRTGKGIRGAPRDAMLAEFATPATRGRIFGFHRAMDHAGAVIGPLVATVVLLLAPENYRLLFALTIVPGAIAVGILFLVPEPARTIEPTRAAKPGTTAEPRTASGRRTTELPRSFYAYLAVLVLFSLGNSTDAFLLLRLSDALGGASYIPLLWAALHVVKASLSMWGGVLSDRIGRTRVIVIGWMVYSVVYLGFATAASASALIAWFLLYGVYFALTEGVERALVADLVPAERRGMAFGIYNAVLGVGALLASVMFGLLYERFSPAVAFGTGAALAGLAAVLLPFVRADVMIVGSNASHSRNQ